ncbi:MAG: DUF1292 domain-containing protein [Ruminococcus sp.]|jgi:hypothetical protein
MEKIKFVEEDGTEVEFYIEEQTRMNGYNYLLVTDSQGDEAQAYILKDLSEDADPQARYVMVEDDIEFETMSRLFSDMLEDVDLETES